MTTGRARGQMPFLFAVVMLVAPATGLAQAQHIDKIEIAETGIYKAETKDKVVDPGQTTGTRRVVTDIKNIEVTTTIPLRRDTEFGLRYTVVGEPNGVVVPLKIVRHYPSPGLRSPKTGKLVLQEETMVKRRIGDKAYTGYKLVADWTMVPGVWRFEIWSENRKYAEQSFTLVKQ